MSVGPVRTTPVVRPVRPAQAIAPAANAASAKPAQAPAPKAPVVARGPVDTGSKFGGLVAGTAAGLGGAFSIALLWMVGGGSLLSGGPIGLGLMALSTAAGAGLGWLGGDRLGDMLEGKKAAGKPHTAAQVAGGAVGGVLGLAGGFWLGAMTLGGLVGTPAIGIVTAVAAAGLGALGGAEGAKRLASKLFG